jgi:hypothetical protein
MNKPSKFQIAAALLVAILTLTMMHAWDASAQAPSNDDFDNATLIGSLPFTDSIDTTEATVASDDPFPCNYYGRSATVWYIFTPTQNMTIATSTAGSNYPTTTSVYTGSRGSLSQVDNCLVGDASFRIQVTAGVTYYFMISRSGNGPYPYPGPGGGGGNLVFSVSQIQAPANDNFANATIISSLPYSNHTDDTTTASLEAGEIKPSCIEYFGSPGKTIWYSYTPLQSGSVSARTNSSYTTFMGAYTGSGLTNLVERDCRVFGNIMTFFVDAGVTYYFQIGAIWDDGGSLDFSLDFTPPPTASFYYYPYDPSIFDTIQFYDTSYDPGYVGFQSYTWDFGDGSTATGNSTNHRFLTDGDYNVSHTVTTVDGRTGAVTQVVSVRTHDVAITKFTVPQSTRVGQTRQITVSLKNIRYPETVRVELYVSTPSGYVQVGSLIMAVPVRSGNRTTDFNFSYTFTKDDGSVGKVTFRAIATIINARDALPADNEAISDPTKVTP